jgi:hypothetical protein
MPRRLAPDTIRSAWLTQPGRLSEKPAMSRNMELPIRTTRRPASRITG